MTSYQHSDLVAVALYNDRRETICYVDDLVNGLMQLMRSPDDFTGPVNLGGEFTILELAQKIIAMTGSKSKLVYRPLPADDPTQCEPDIALAKRVLDWTPRVALDGGLIQGRRLLPRLRRRGAITTFQAKRHWNVITA